MNTNDPAELLEAAADLIEAKGHAKHVLVEFETGAYCAMGAMNKAHHDSPYHKPGVGGWLDFSGGIGAAVRAVTKHLGLEPVPALDRPHWAWQWGPQPLANRRVTALVNWNNADEREPGDVIDAFRHAAKDLRNEAAA